ncbi:MAG: carboxypeptidase M32 [Clostridia bacterium]|nr:carboxypeptidase M32 [Clostridia bacterium]
MTLETAAAKLTGLEQTLHAYGHALGALSLDGATVAPKNAAAGRARTMGVLSGVVHGILTAEETGETLETILSAPDAEPALRRRAELMREDRDMLVLVPADEYRAYCELTAEADAVWHEAKPKSDWAAFEPYLEKIVAYNRRLAARRDPDAPAYDVLLGLYEKGTDMALLDPFFAALRRDLTPVILAVKEKPAPDTAFLHRHYPVETQRVFSDRLMAMMGLNRDDCAIGETEHPFTDGFNKHDVRITTHYHEDDVSASMYSVIHEGGHALYELGGADELEGTGLAGGVSMSIHESQSRFYENLIGRSLPFCRAVLPVMRELFPGQTEGVDADKLYRALNRAEPSLIRTEADELTYGMHIMIRYELEKAMIGGSLAVRDVPGEWNRMYREYLGIEVPDHRRGVLQDMHWAGGMLGYFPSYALGSAYGVQMLERMERETDVWGAVERGDLTPVTDWLREHIHRFGRTLPPRQLLEQAIGGPFDPARYTAYLTRKYSALYAL